METTGNSLNAVVTLKPYLITYIILIVFFFLKKKRKKTGWISIALSKKVKNEWVGVMLFDS